MSTLKATNLQHASATSPNITLGSDGSVAVGGGNISPQTGFKNRVINGDMRIDQRNNGASVTATTSNLFTVDRWQSVVSQNSKFTIQQNANSVTPPVGFTNYIGVVSSSAYSVVTGDYFMLRQRIEGFNTADLGWGTAGAQTVAVSFWVRSSLTGTFGGALINAGDARSYPFSYTISAANTWEQKTVIVSGDTSGTWNTGNSIGVEVRFSLGGGSTFSGTANTWQAGNFIQPSGSTSVVGTNGATFYITGVQLEKGTVATPFEFRSVGQELALCQRYYQVFGLGFFGWWTTSGSFNAPISFHTAMRSAPTVVILKTDMNISDGTAGRIGSPASISSVASNAGKGVTVSVSGFSGAIQFRFASSNDGADLFGFSAEL